MDTKEIIDQIEVFNDEYQASIEKLAYEVFKKKVVPFLDKRKWTLLTGNGTWLFLDQKGNQLHPEDEGGELQKIENYLMIMAGRFALGEYMPDFKKYY